MKAQPAPRRTILFALLLWLPAATLAQRDFSNVEVKATHVAGKVYMLTGAGGNIGASVGADGVLIVDDQFAPLADKIRAALGTVGDGKLRFVLNTHYHGDHTGGNPVFGTEATIVAHQNVRKRLATGAEPMAPVGLPVITFDRSLSVHFNGEEIRVLHFPSGHTDGDSVIFFTGSNVVHMGDDFFAGRFPFVDLDAGGSVQGLTRNVRDVLARLPAGARVIPGHGDLSDASGLREFLAMLEATTAFVQQEMRDGMDVSEIQEQGLPEEWAVWGTGFINADRWIQTIYDSLARAE